MSESALQPPKPPATPAPPAVTPAMKQYFQFKAQHPDYVLFFRMGDFYEMFYDDARLAARVLGVTLTSRSRGGIDATDAVPMAGVPFHAVESYLRRMIAAGHKVALCEQMEDAALAKGVVRREVVRLMTPGTLTDDPLLDGRTANHLAAVAFHLTKRDGYRAGLAWIELSTGQVTAMSGNEADVLDEIARLRPAEILVPELPSGQPHDIAGKIEPLGGIARTIRPGWQFSAHHAAEQVRKQWGSKTAAGFGFEDDDPGIFAVAAVLSYLGETQKAAVVHLRPPHRHVTQDHLSIDPASWRSLEIDRTIRSGGTEGSLLAAIDRTRTSMGGRLLRQWLRAPLRDLEHIAARQNAIAAFVQSPAGVASVVAATEGVCDIERIVGRVCVGRALPRDLAGLSRCLAALPLLIDRIAALPAAHEVAPELESLRDFCSTQADFLGSAIQADPAPHLREGGVIASGYNAELDRLRAFATDGHAWLTAYQAKLAADTGISSLKVSYNKVFGYYIEVTDSHRDKVPVGWTRKQTVKNAERYITSELKQHETDALGAHDRAIALEQALFEQVRQTLLPAVPTYQELAAAIARIDVLANLATLAIDRRYCRPVVSGEPGLKIVDGRHPVLDLQLGSEFVANDTTFNPGDTLALITGPNMAGKSTYIRQVALIVLLAQVGSYVPAKSASIGVVDRIFTRIGASDELHSGQSTFMVEMTETANILNNATADSLVILDEIGRGTSTLDGLSLAWAISEDIAARINCRALFATHYHELTSLAERFPGVKNLNVAVREWEDHVIFLHRILEGGTDRSYGIHVARLAGVPRSVLNRAKELLAVLAVKHAGGETIAASPARRRAALEQLPLFADPAREIYNALQSLDLDQMTAEQALQWLRSVKPHPMP